MLYYRFASQRNSKIENLGGLTMANDAEAIEFGKLVVQDLIRRHSEPHAGWTMEITESGRAVFQCRFRIRGAPNSKESRIGSWPLQLAASSFVRSPHLFTAREPVVGAQRRFGRMPAIEVEADVRRTHLTPPDLSHSHHAANRCSIATRLARNRDIKPWTARRAC